MRAAALLAALASCAASVTTVAASRVEVPFSYAWRFHLGPGPDDGPGPGNGWGFPMPVSNCTNLYEDPDRITDADCSTACAYNPECLVWLHNYVPWANCLHGDANATCTPAKSNASALGAARSAATPLQTAYAIAAANLPEDAGWPIVDAPHDALMSLNNTFSRDAGDAAHGYRVRTVVWYRKHFMLPAAWAPTPAGDGGLVFLRFEGVVHVAQLYLNGAYLGVHNSAYGGFTVRLDNVTAAVWGGPNVLALRADASFGSGHWYEGGGLARRVTLVRTDAAASLVENGVYAPAELAPGATAAAVSAEWQNSAPAGGAAVTASVSFQLLDPASGALLASAVSAPSTVPAGGAGKVTSTAQLALPAAVLSSLWSLKSPTLYTLNVSLVVSSGAGGGVVDTTAVTVGYRTTHWDPATGFYLNGAPVRQRGFSHHNSFAGVGVAIPLRLDAFRAQAARALGANTWRMTHNPAAPELYGLLDAVGMMVRRDGARVWGGETDEWEGEGRESLRVL
jgi:beta-galactosidase/beta-glucuronidase